MCYTLKTESVAKLFFLVSCSGLFMYAVLAFYTFHTAYLDMHKLQNYQDNQGLPNPYEYNIRKYRKKLKHILIWTMVNGTENKMGEGPAPFVNHDCSYFNCYLTTKKDLLGADVSNFDAIIFDLNNIKAWKKTFFPSKRSQKQKYIFYSTISSDEMPVCNIHMDNYFNWTWTYKIKSDIINPFIEVEDLDGNFVAPKPVVNWISDWTTLNEDELKPLKLKNKAMAWVVSKCNTKNNRLLFARRLRKGFEESGLVFDIYGCGQKTCPTEGCMKAIEKDYYFYFAPESSFDEDYVTDEVLTAYQHHAVPIVLGGANYRRFLPEGSYINAATTSMDKLIALVGYIIKNPRVYNSFHRWRKHYVIKFVEKYRGLCDICNYLNDKDRVDTPTFYEDFRTWWYTRPLYERCFPKSPENISEILSYVNDTRPRHDFT